MAKPKNASDKRFDGLVVQDYVMAGSSRASDALGGEFDNVSCVRCGAKIVHVIVTSHGPMGGDCVATLTGDNSTRKTGRKIVEAIQKGVAYHGRLVRPRIRTSTGQPGMFALEVDPVRGGRSWTLGFVRQHELPMAFEILTREIPAPFDPGWEHMRVPVALDEGATMGLQATRTNPPDRDYVWWVTCPEHGSQQPRPVFLSDGVTPRMLYGGGMSVDSPKGYDYQRGYCPVCGVVCPLRSVSTPRGGKRKNRKPLERCTGKCLGGSKTGSCECECRGRCHGAGVCTCGAQRRRNPDEDRRGRERRARAEGGVAGEVARLTDAMRAGLPVDAVEYAAVLGDETARAVVPEWRRSVPPGWIGAARSDAAVILRPEHVNFVAYFLTREPWGAPILDEVYRRSLARVDAITGGAPATVVRQSLDEGLRLKAAQSVDFALEQLRHAAADAVAYAAYGGPSPTSSAEGVGTRAWAAELQAQRDDMVALLLQRPRSNPPVPAPRGRFLPALASSGVLPRGEYVPPVTSFELATSGAVPLVYVPEGSYEHQPANDALAALITTPGALAAPGAWDDLISRVGTRGTVYLIDRRGDQWRVRDVVYYPGGRDGALDVEHLGRRGRMQVDLREAYGHVLPVLVYKPLRSNPPRGDERLRDLYRAVEAGAPLGDFSAFPALMTELQRAGRFAPWGADHGVLLLWQGPVTGTDEVESLPRLGETAQAIAVIQARVGAGGWSDPRVDVLIPVTGPRGDGWARPWQVEGVPAWVTALANAPRLLPKPPRAKRKLA